MSVAVGEVILAFLIGCHCGNLRNDGRAIAVIAGGEMDRLGENRRVIAVTLVASPFVKPTTTALCSSGTSFLRDVIFFFQNTETIRYCSPSSYDRTGKLPRTLTFASRFCWQKKHRDVPSVFVTVQPSGTIPQTTFIIDNTTDAWKANELFCNRRNVIAE